MRRPLRLGGSTAVRRLMLPAQKGQKDASSGRAAPQRGQR